jgi:hypothetical protein
MHLFPTRRRSDRGATTVEYVGVVGMVVVLVIALIVLAPGVADGARKVVSKAFCTIGAPLGFAGCSNEDLPGYVPTDCTVSSHEGTAGGSVAIIAEVKGESGYKLTRIRERQDDGTIKDSYVVRTKGVVGGGYEFSLGGGAEVNTGSGGVSAKGSASAKIEGDVTWGKEFTFDNQDDAQAFIDRYKDNFGEFGSDPEGAPEAESEYYELGAKGTISGEVGPLEGSVGQRGVLGVQNYANGDRKVKMAMTVDAAVSLGIPVPESVLKLSAEAKVSAMVTADITFDKDGNVSGMAGSVQLTPTVAAGVELNTDLAKPSTGKHAKPQTLQGLTLPPLLRLDHGRNYVINFSTSFKRDDGSYSHDSIGALSDQISSWITGGDGITDEQRAAITEQLNEHSQITYNEYDYSRDEQKYGGKVKVLFVKVGGEVHVVTVDQDLVSGYFYDPVQGLWTENIICES